MGKPKGRKDWENWIDEQIREAQERGDFDNLPGKGRPLDLAPNPYAQDRELAFKVLKDAGYAPEWIELDKAIRARLDRERATLLRRWQWRETRLGELGRQGDPPDRQDRWAVAEGQRVEESWQRAVVDFEAQIVALNREIDELNLKVPGMRFQRARIVARREIERLIGGDE